jgi:hypothetical protein
LIDVASCQIERSGNKVLCHLMPKESLRADRELLRHRFLDNVTE